LLQAIIRLSHQENKRESKRFSRLSSKLEEQRLSDYYGAPGVALAGVTTTLAE
jgi:hypothetical protein